MTVRQTNTGEQRLMKSNNLITTRILVTFLILVLGALGVWIWWNDAMNPADAKDATPIVFVVPRGQGAKEVTRRLKDTGLVRNQIGFYLLVRFVRPDKGIQAGDFRLNKSMNAYEILEQLSLGMLDVWVTILEGWRKEEIALRLAKDVDVPEREFLSVATEGMMFPDTYLIPKDATAGAIMGMLRQNFNEKVTPQILADAKKNGLSENELIILASLVEREGRSSLDRPIIAGILLNRLQKNWPLQVDATLQYALGYQSLEKTWWKKELTDEDKKIRSPYNTYINTGLPPGPICSPGLESFVATAYPQMTEYMYYIHDKAGTAHYAKTIEEHLENVATYLR